MEQHTHHVGWASQGICHQIDLAAVPETLRLPLYSLAALLGVVVADLLWHLGVLHVSHDHDLWGVGPAGCDGGSDRRGLGVGQASRLGLGATEHRHTLVGLAGIFLGGLGLGRRASVCSLLAFLRTSRRGLLGYHAALCLRLSCRLRYTECALRVKASCVILNVSGSSVRPSGVLGRIFKCSQQPLLGLAIPLQPNHSLAIVIDKPNTIGP